MYRALLSIGILLAGVFYFIIDPEKGILPACPFYSLTQCYCPGCGSQRGLHALLHGDLLGALNFNPLMVLGLLYFIVEIGIWLFRLFGRKYRALSSYRHTPLIVLISVLLFWICRNIPMAPFHLLAP